MFAGGSLNQSCLNVHLSFRQDIRRASDSVRYNHPVRQYVNTIISKCPDTFQDSLSKHLDDFKDYSDNRPQVDDAQQQL